MFQDSVAIASFSAPEKNTHCGCFPSEMQEEKKIPVYTLLGCNVGGLSFMTYYHLVVVLGPEVNIQGTC